MALSRRCFLCSLPAVCLAADSQKGHTFSAPAKAYRDASTDSVVFRLTDPAHTSILPAHYGRPVSRRGNFLLMSSDVNGTMNLYRLDYKSGEVRQLTDAAGLDPISATLTADDRGFCYLDHGRLLSAAFAGLRAREVYRIAEGFEAVPG